jgi:hypothetical protein
MCDGTAMFSPLHNGGARSMTTILTCICTREEEGVHGQSLKGLKFRVSLPFSLELAHGLVQVILVLVKAKWQGDKIKQHLSDLVVVVVLVLVLLLQ